MPLKNKDSVAIITKQAYKSNTTKGLNIKAKHMLSIRCKPTLPLACYPTIFQFLKSILALPECVERPEKFPARFCTVPSY